MRPVLVAARRVAILRAWLPPPNSSTIDMGSDAPNYRTVTPYLKLPNSARLLKFLKNAFNAVEKDKLLKPDGTLLHAEVIIGDTLLMLHELPPQGVPKPCTLYLRVDDTDATFEQAVTTGATPIFQPTDM